MAKPKVAPKKKPRTGDGVNGVWLGVTLQKRNLKDGKVYYDIGRGRAIGFDETTDPEVIAEAIRVEAVSMAKEMLQAMKEVQRGAKKP